ERVDREARLESVRRLDDLPLEVDRHLHAGLLLGEPDQSAHLRLLELDGQQAVLEAVAAEDVGEARGDHGAEAVVLERPRRVLAGGAAAEIAAGDQDAGAPVRRVVELEIGIERSVLPEAPVIEEELAEAGPLDPLQELL